VRYGKQTIAIDVLTYVAITLVLIFTLFPIYWLISISLKKSVEAFAIPPKWVFIPTLSNYKEVIFGGGLRRVVGGELMHDILNSAIVTASTVGLATLIGSPAAYSFARFTFGGKDALSFWILSLLMMPAIVALIPFRLTINRLNLYDTHLALIIVNMSFILPFFIWMMKGFFQQIPQELEEAAMMDGCSRMGAFRKIAMPLSAPGLAATIILCAIFSWNEFLFALGLTGKYAKTGPVSVLAFIGLEEMIWGKLCAGGVLITVPPLIFAFLAHKYVIRGLTFGAIKG